MSRETAERDTERLDWLSRNCSKLGIKADYRWENINRYEPYSDMSDAEEYTDIRKRIDAVMEAGKEEGDV